MSSCAIFNRCDALLRRYCPAICLLWVRSRGSLNIALAHHAQAFAGKHRMAEQYRRPSFGRLTIAESIKFGITMRGNACVNHIQLHIVLHEVLNILSSRVSTLAAYGGGHDWKWTKITWDDGESR